MNLGSLLLAVALFVAFVPGVVLTIPKGSPHMTQVLVHAVLFGLVLSLTMHYYWTGIFEFFGNYGSPKTPCPNGYVVGTNQGNGPDCVPVGQATYSPYTGY